MNVPNEPCQPIEESITILKDEYEELLEECRLLDCLRMAGVDNWEGFEYAIELFQEEM